MRGPFILPFRTEEYDKVPSLPKVSLPLSLLSTPPTNFGPNSACDKGNPSVTASNVEAATVIKKELKASAGLGLLSAYCGSDSGSESDSD